MRLSKLARLSLRSTPLPRSARGRPAWVVNPRGLPTQPEGWKETGETPRGESYFQPHSSSDPHSRTTARRPASRSPGAQAAHFSRPRRAYRLPPTERAPAQRRGGLPAPARAPRPRRRPPSLKSEQRSRGCRARLGPARPSASFLTLRLAEETEPLFNGSEAHAPQPLPSEVKNEAKQWL